MQIALDLRWHIAGPPGEDLPAALIALLDAAATSGNLRLAARESGISYRHAWGLVKHWERRLGQTLLGLERGRGAAVTPAGDALRTAWHRTAERLAAPLAEAAAQAERALAPCFGARDETALELAASHSFGLSLLARLLRERDVPVDLRLLGSEAALERYARGEARVAGFHLPRGAIGERLLARFQRLLDARRDVLLLVETRELGFIARPGVRCGAIGDIARRGLRFINRQSGSGSRLVFDLLLADAGLKPEDIEGYHEEEYTHVAVAAVVKGGAADVGFGARAAAEQFALGFAPIVTEHYLVALPRADAERWPLSELRRTLASQRYKRQLAATPGCDPHGSGKLLEVTALPALVGARAPRARGRR